MITFPPTHYVKETTEVRFGRYANDRLAVYTLDDDGQVAFKLSVNLDDQEGAIEPGEHEFWVKTWGENQSVLEAIRASGLAILTGRVFVVNEYGSRACLMRLTPVGIAELAEQQESRGNH